MIDRFEVEKPDITGRGCAKCPHVYRIKTEIGREVPRVVNPDMFEISVQGKIYCIGFPLGLFPKHRAMSAIITIDALPGSFSISRESTPLPVKCPSIK